MREGGHALIRPRELGGTKHAHVLATEREVGEAPSLRHAVIRGIRRETL
jgi:hypothetical protein